MEGIKTQLVTLEQEVTTLKEELSHKVGTVGTAAEGGAPEQGCSTCTGSLPVWVDMLNCFTLASVSCTHCLPVCVPQATEVERLDQKLEEERSYTAKILDEVSQCLVIVWLTFDLNFPCCVTFDLTPLQCTRYKLKYEILQDSIKQVRP